MSDSPVIDKGDDSRLLVFRERRANARVVGSSNTL
jgi:hypothetical protein